MCAILYLGWGTLKTRRKVITKEMITMNTNLGFVPAWKILQMINDTSDNENPLNEDEAREALKEYKERMVITN